MNVALAHAFMLLEIFSSRQQHIFFSWLAMAGYIEEAQLQKAFTYLHAFAPFAADQKLDEASLLKRLQHIFSACRDESGKLLISKFIDEFGQACHFTASDYVDLLVFLSQTAFDRAYGAERTELSGKDWMSLPENQVIFFEMLSMLNMYTGRQLSLPSAYVGVGVMGASYPRLQRRLSTFEATLPKISSKTKPLVLSGKRELSVALDTSHAMTQVADFLGRSVQLETKILNGQKRECLEGEPAVNEADLAHFLIHAKGLEGQIESVDGQIEKGHWRTTTTENAKDITHQIVGWLKTQSRETLEGQMVKVLIIVEQPYLSRMCRQVQRAINEKITEHGFPCHVQVEGIGDGLAEVWSNPDDQLKMIREANSEIACTFSERYQDVRLNPEYSFRRRPEHLMFATRDKEFKSLLTKSHSQTGEITALLAARSTTFSFREEPAPSHRGASAAPPR